MADIYKESADQYRADARAAQRKSKAAKAARKQAKATQDQNISNIYKEEADKYRDSARDARVAAKTWNDASASVRKVKSDWSAAKQKAKTDPSYKNSNEYKTAKKKNTSRIVEKCVYGKEGQVKIAALKSSGYTDKGAKALTVFTGQRLTTGQLSMGTRYRDLLRKYS